jgi:ubiquinone/menaquinone biosynthesis C-methylase UbiE
MRPASQKVFDRNYYLHVCLGSEEFKKSYGRRLHPKVKKMLDTLPIFPHIKILEIGCGRGDSSLYIAQKASSVIGIDYSEEGIKLANEIRKKCSRKIQEKTNFYLMNATKLKFKDDTFDMVIFIDTIDHLTKQQVEKTFYEIKRVLKKNGTLFIKTCSNRILLDYTYHKYTYPINQILTGIDKKLKGLSYSSLPKNPRTPEAKKQHINEPDLFYLRDLFKRFKFKGTINGETGFVKDIKGFRSYVYNFLIALYPLSKILPFNIFFSHSFSAILKND